MLEEIQTILRENADSEYQEFIRKMVPTSQKVYGVRMPVINDMVKKYKTTDFDFIQKLWKSGAYEERLLAAKLLGKIAKKNPNLIFQFIYDYSEEITDWAVCDTIGMQALKPLVKSHEKEIFQLSEDLIHSSYLWKKRLSLVVIEYYTRFPEMHKKINAQIDILRGDKEYYVKKAISWLERNMKKER